MAQLFTENRMIKTITIPILFGRTFRNKFSNESILNCEINRGKKPKSRISGETDYRKCDIGDLALNNGNVFSYFKKLHSSKDYNKTSILGR